MARRRLAVAAVLVLLVAGGVAITVAPGLLAPSEYERTTVTVADEDGTTLATVDVRIADTSRKRYVGLSATDSLDDDEGMLFVHDGPGQYAYVMRDMAFPLDILFVAPNGTITRVHHAELPPPNTPESALERYRGRGQYVLEVPYGYTNRTGVTVGDTLSWPGRTAG